MSSKLSVRKVLRSESLTQNQIETLVKRISTPFVKDKTGEYVRNPNFLDPDVLTEVQRLFIMEYLRVNEDWSPTRIAKLLKMSPVTVSRRISLIDKYCKARFVAQGIDSEGLYTDLNRVKNMVQAKAYREKKWGLYWKAQTDTVEKAVRLGLVGSVGNGSQPNDFLNHYPTDINVGEVIDAEFVETVEEERELMNRSEQIAIDKPKPISKVDVKAIAEKLSGLKTSLKDSNAQERAVERSKQRKKARKKVVEEEGKYDEHYIQEDGVL